MSSTVLVFSADELRCKLRGNIIKKILSRSGIESLFFHRILVSGQVIAHHDPDVVIFDTVGCLAEEINYLRNLCRTPARTAAILLGSAEVLEGFEGPFIRRDLCLDEPFDPELIITKLKEFLLLQEEKRDGESDALEKNLKHFLNLE